MRFSYPEVIGEIKDIRAIYHINEDQAQDLDTALTTVSNNASIDTADKTHVTRWEKSLGITTNERDTLSERRFRIKSMINERLPYSYRILVNKLNALCDPSGYRLEVDTDAQTVVCYVNLSNKGLLSDFENILDEIIPMNMTVTVELLKNNHKRLSGFTHSQLSGYTHTQLEEEILKA